MKFPAFKNIDILDFMGQVVEINTDHYKTDLEYDKKTLTKVLEGPALGQRFLWVSRKSGTHLFQEREVFLERTSASHAWQFWQGGHYHGLYFLLEPKMVENGRLIGDVTQIDGAKHAEYAKECEHPSIGVVVTFETSDKDYRCSVSEYHDKADEIVKKHGKIKDVYYVAFDEEVLNRAMSVVRTGVLKGAKETPVDQYLKKLASKKAREQKAGA
ncbi:MAG: hypothetical protein R3Y55_03760 [Rikenellaceae bacterium]